MADDDATWFFVQDVASRANIQIHDLADQPTTARATYKTVRGCSHLIIGAVGGRAEYVQRILELCKNDWEMTQFAIMAMEVVSARSASFGITAHAPIVARLLRNLGWP